MATVTILQRRLVQYRLGLFDALRDALAEQGIELRLVYGSPSPSDQVKNDSASLPWADEVPAHWLRIGSTELLWQRGIGALGRADLVVMTQENKILSNYPVMVRRRLGGGRIAYWGHGRNLQSQRPHGLRERWKAELSTKVDWWFAYNESTRDILVANGFPPDRITCLYNAIDDVAFANDLASVDEARLAKLRHEIGLADGAPLALYCGSLYAEKRVELLVQVADRVHNAIPGFRLVVMGDGPTRPVLEEALASRPWARCIGTTTGVDKAAWFRLATLQLSPGAVGLHVLDSFVSGVPLVSTRSALHGPEIEYLEHGVNGLLLGDDPETMATEVVELLCDDYRLAAMVEAGRRDAAHYTLANMTANFVDGIRDCLSR